MTSVSVRVLLRTVTYGAFMAFVNRAGAQTTVTLPLDVTGEVRVRSEYEHVPGLPADLFTYLRTRFGVRVTASPGVRILVQMQDSRVLGTEGIGVASAADVLELHQGYLEITRALHAHPIAMRAGRQEIALGNERLVGVSNWGNLGRAFDGFRVTLSADTSTKGVQRWTVNAIGVTVEERGHRFGTTSVDAHPTDHTLIGLFSSRELTRTTAVETAVMYDGSGKFRRYRNSDRGTAYARMRATLPLSLRGDVEGAYQFGHQQYAATDTSVVTVAQAVGAWLLAARLTTPALGPHKAVVTAGVDMLSGDATPNNATYSAFSTMYASNHAFYGLQDVIGDPAASTHERGLIDAFITGGMSVTNRVSLRAEAHEFSMEAGANTPLATEIDLLMPWRVSSAANVELGYSAFIARSGAASQSLGAVNSKRHWAYLQLRAGF
jgi:hypothetical protein